MKILFVPTLNPPVILYRMENFVKYLRKMGHEVAFSYNGPEKNETCQWENNIDKNFISEINELAYQCDISIWQVIHSQKGLSMILALQESYRKPFISEFDDDIYSVNSSAPSHIHVQPGSNIELWGDEQIKKSDGLVVSTEYLRKIYSTKNSNVQVIPNAIDFEVWDNLKAKKRKDKYIKIGWEGGAGHSINLRLIKKVVSVILKKYPNVVFHFRYGGFPIDFLNHKRVIFDDFRHWTSINKYPQMMKDLNMDIGIAPLRDLEFNRAKSNCRWLELSALKVPTIASDVEPYKCIEQGVTGFLAREENEWVEYLGGLIENESLRRKIGQNAYEKVKKDYNVEEVTKRYVEVLKGFIK